MQRLPSEELLVAYVDGELDEEDVATVEAALALAPDLRAQASGLRDSAALLRPAFNEPMHEAPPARLLAALERGRRHAAPRIAWLAAAAVAVLVLGAGGGYVASDWRFQQIMQQTENTRLSDELAMRNALAEALETNISGTPVSWQSPTSGRSGQAVPVRTFRNAEGAFCREYRETVTLGTGVEEVFGIACRRDNGIWQTVALMAGQ